MKKILALILAGCMVLSMAACGGSETAAPTEENTATTEETKEEAPAEKAEETAEEVAAEVPAGGKVGVCIYKFDDAFMTTYRNALQAILEEKGYEVNLYLKGLGENPVVQDLYIAHARFAAGHKAVSMAVKKRNYSK